MRQDGSEQLIAQLRPAFGRERPGARRLGRTGQHEIDIVPRVENRQGAAQMRVETAPLQQLLAVNDHEVAVLRLARVKGGYLLGALGEKYAHDQLAASFSS